MAIKSILITNTEMVRAILDGSKTCIRQIIKGYIPQNAQFGYSAFTPDGTISCRGLFETAGRPGYGEKFFKLPYQPGDILYVRETWCKSLERYLYRADYSDTEKFYQNGKEIEIKWRPSSIIPREAARIFLKVTNVRVERLQSITEGGAIREGAEGEKCHHTNTGAFGCTDCMNTGWIEPPQVEFMQIWNSTIKKSDIDRYGWDANPWVWVIEFERCEKPEGV